ncbi:MAG: threonylcarbamoyl-AMP synthase [Candidatus Aenigmarchaeota archaeon]|nr:threonylcarbamoyl-AMP synthase [Candidatus Aenigmarchaeota archaeon]
MKMRVVKLSEVLGKPPVRREAIDAMRNGMIFIYPTDTIYGIGCNAERAESVSRIAEAKGRESGKRFSVIAPGKGWIWKNASLSAANKKLADSILPGPYTIIVKAGPSAPKAVVSGEKSMGVRIPSHPVSGLVEQAGIPFVTTSVNVSGEEHAGSVRDIPEKIKGITDWVIDAGRIGGLASRVFDLRTDDVKILRY